jgi:hypothetical protein
MINYFNALSACYRRCSSQGEYYIKLFAIGKENPYELGEDTIFVRLLLLSRKPDFI